MQFCKSAKVILKNKLISSQKVFSGQRILQVFLLLSVFFLSATKAQASTSPLENLVKFSKEKIAKTKEVTIVKPVVTEQPEVKQVFNIPTKVPEKVSDPVEIEKAAEFAANATGVRKAFIMGLLAVESDLGRNPGKCTYQEVEKGAQEDYQSGRLSKKAWETFKKRRETIKGVARDLGYDYEKLSVSCNPGAAYAGTGGAMGIPQFMPDTWLEYKDRIAAIVGKENPDPWDEKDAAVAVALKLSDVSGVTAHNRLAERNAAKLYLSGTTSWRYDWYANQILYWAENYQNLMS